MREKKTQINTQSYSKGAGMGADLISYACPAHYLSALVVQDWQAYVSQIIVLHGQSLKYMVLNYYLYKYKVLNLFRGETPYHHTQVTESVAEKNILKCVSAIHWYSPEMAPLSQNNRPSQEDGDSKIHFTTAVIAINSILIIYLFRHFPF